MSEVSVLLVSAAGKTTADTTQSVDDDGPGVTGGREHARLIIVVLYRPLLGNLAG